MNVKYRNSNQDHLIFRCTFLTFAGDENDGPAIEMKSVPYGSSIEMGCRVDFDGPIKYKWSKLNGLLPVAFMYEVSNPQVTFKLSLRQINKNHLSFRTK